MLQSPQFHETISVPQLYQHVIEELFAHFFPDTNDPKIVYSKEDVEFFLLFANEQNKWKIQIHGVYHDQSENLINSSKLKFYLDRILCRGWSGNGTIAKPLTFYKSEVSIMMLLVFSNFIVHFIGIHRFVYVWGKLY